MKERLYSEKETGALIQKAFELQQKEDAEGGYGLTEQELRKLAAEMGIRPQFLEDALQIQNTKEPTKTFHVWGAPLRVTQEKVIEGIVSEELWEEMVHKLRFAYKNQGRVERVGNTRDWIYATKDDEIVALSITTKNGRTRLRLREERYGLQLGLVFSTIFFLILIGIVGDVASDAGFSGWLFGFVTLLLGYFAQRFAVQQSHRKPTKGETLMKEFSQMIETETTTPIKPPERTTATEQTAAHLSWLDVEAPETESEAGKKRSRTRI